MFAAHPAREVVLAEGRQLLDACSDSYVLRSLDSATRAWMIRILPSRSVYTTTSIRAVPIAPG